MTLKLGKPPISSGRKANDQSLFSGLWIRWSALNPAERFVCANIVLMPAWWLAGLLDYMPELLLLCVVLYEWRRYGGLRPLKRPSLIVIAWLAFNAYYFIDAFLIFFDANPAIAAADIPRNFITINYLVKSLLDFSLPCLAWYIQSNNVRVRLEVIAWAVSVSVVQMLVTWLVVQFFPGAFDHPPRSLYGMLTGKSKDYVDGLGTNNYLLLYDQTKRYRFFFGNNQPCAAFLGFTGLLVLDIKNRFWSLLLIVGCIFLLSLSATRSVWLAFPAALIIGFLLKSSKVKGAWLVFALLAIVSFSTLSIPPITNLVFNTATDTATAVGEVRGGSTAGRLNVYKQTLQEIPNKPFFGHKVEGEKVTTTVGNDPFGPEVGSHSFILGVLLYRGGLVGFGLFATFWGSLIFWFHNTRFNRPTNWFSEILLFSLQLNVTGLQLTMTMGILMLMMLRKPALNLNRNAF